MTATSDTDRDLAQLVAMAGGLDAYVDGGRPYQPIAVDLPGGGQRTATQSIGVLLDLADGLEARHEELGPERQAALDEALARLRQVREGRRSAYGEMLAHELRSQLDTWKWFLDDCRRGESDCRDQYAREVAARRRIQQLLDEAADLGIDIADSRRRTGELDEALRGIFRRGPYRGPAGMSDRYPEGTYWWLYGGPS